MTTCYRKSAGNVFDESGVDVPCPGTQNADGHSSCCYQGDICLSNGICHYTHSSTGGSGYYMQDCTDETYNDASVCPQSCTDQALPDVVYSYQSQLWLCCGTDGNGTVTCGDPTNESFSAPPPDQLKAANSTSSSTSSSQVSSSASTSSTASSTRASLVTSTTSSAAMTTSSSTTNDGSSSNSGLSSGAAAGIGVGVAVVAIILATVVFFVWRKRRQTSPKRMPDNAPPYEEHKHLYSDTPTGNNSGIHKIGAQNSAIEMSGQGTRPSQPIEMSTQNTRIELA